MIILSVLQDPYAYAIPLKNALVLIKNGTKNGMGFHKNSTLTHNFCLRRVQNVIIYKTVKKNLF